MTERATTGTKSQQTQVEDTNDLFDIVRGERKLRKRVLVNALQQQRKAETTPNQMMSDYNNKTAWKIDPSRRLQKNETVLIYMEENNPLGG